MLDSILPSQPTSALEFQLLTAFDLTCHKDYVDLTKKLLTDIRMIPGVDNAHVYELYGRSNDLFDNSNKEKKLVLRDVINILKAPFALDDVINNFPANSSFYQPYTTQLDNGLLQTTFPIYNDSMLERVLVLESEILSTEYWDSILFSVRVYGNILTIIDDKDRDRLTGLLNRHTFDNQVSHIIEFSKHETSMDRGKCHNASWLAILDIDFFKKINDKHGHVAGDDVLLIFAKLMEKSFRYSDILFRYGGEEFIVILNGCTKEGAFTSLERFRQMIESHDFENIEQVTVSIGYIQLIAQNNSATLIDEADKALYFAKDTGRNRTISYSDLPVEKNVIEGELIPA